MRRRRLPRTAGVPEQLARFVPSEWPGRCAHEQLRAWEDACLAWLREDPAHALPLGEYGDIIDLLREAMRISHAIPACPWEYRPAVHWTNGPPPDYAE